MIYWNAFFEQKRELIKQVLDRTPVIGMKVSRIYIRMEFACSKNRVLGQIEREHDNGIWGHLNLIMRRVSHALCLVDAATFEHIYHR